MIASEGYREPADYGDVFTVLEEEGVISTALAVRMVDMAGLRNVLAHEYAAIDNDRIYEHLQTLDHFHEFAEAIDATFDLDR